MVLFSLCEQHCSDAHCAEVPKYQGRHQCSRVTSAHLSGYVTCITSKNFVNTNEGKAESEFWAVEPVVNWSHAGHEGKSVGSCRREFAMGAIVQGFKGRVYSFHESKDESV
jgi:hypothetical protein